MSDRGGKRKNAQLMRQHHQRTVTSRGANFLQSELASSLACKPISSFTTVLRTNERYLSAAWRTERKPDSASDRPYNGRDWAVSKDGNTSLTKIALEPGDYGPFSWSLSRLLCSFILLFRPGFVPVCIPLQQRRQGSISTLPPDSVTNNPSKRNRTHWRSVGGKEGGAFCDC